MSDEPRIPARVGLTAEYAFAFRDAVLKIVRDHVPEIAERWPFRSASYEAYYGGGYLILAISPKSERVTMAGSGDPLPLTDELIETVPLSPGTFHVWAQEFRSRYGVDGNALILVVPVTDLQNEERPHVVAQSWDENAVGLWDKAIASAVT